MYNSTKALGMTGAGADSRLRTEAIRTVQSMAPRLIYAIRTKDDLVKIGSSSNLLERMKHIKGGTAELLAIKPGDWSDERDIHRRLAGHATDGREYYFPSPTVLRVVNEMRVPLGLDPIAVSRRWA